MHNMELLTKIISNSENSKLDRRSIWEYLDKIVSISVKNEVKLTSHDCNRGTECVQNITCVFCPKSNAKL